MEGRTDQQCMGRWRRHLDPSVSRKQWTTKEDRKLAELRVRHGANWSAIAKTMKLRQEKMTSNKQCMCVCGCVLLQGIVTTCKQCSEEPKTILRPLLSIGR